jgi:hypothetical protein
MINTTECATRTLATYMWAGLQTDDYDAVAAVPRVATPPPPPPPPLASPSRPRGVASKIGDHVVTIAFDAYADSDADVLTAQALNLKDAGGKLNYARSVKVYSCSFMSVNHYLPYNHARLCQLIITCLTITLGYVNHYLPY